MSGSRMLIIAAVLLGILTLSHTAGAQQIIVDANTLTARAGSSPLLQYRYGNVPFKPYVKELYTPGGINVLLDAPPDHLHHHGLMFACAVNNADFWGEVVGSAEGHFEPVPGKQRHQRFDGVGVGHFTETLRWISKPSNEPLLIEHRTVAVTRVEKATLLLWESILAVPEGKESASLSGSHYHGLGLRFIRSMDATGEFSNPDNEPGVIFRGEERLARSRWCAYTGQADGKTVTIAMFDHYRNPRYPATWFTMAKPFAYMSATLRLHEEPLRILANKPLTLRYGVALWDGRAWTSDIDNLCKSFNRVWIKTTADQDPELAEP
jgi:hypothetical protein